MTAERVDCADAYGQGYSAGNANAFWEVVTRAVRAAAVVSHARWCDTSAVYSP